MKKGERLDALERFIRTALSNGEIQRRRIDELAARVADVERQESAQVEALGEMIMEQAAWINGLTTRVAALERRLAYTDAGSCVDWEAARGAKAYSTSAFYRCPCCGQDVPQGTAHVCENDGSWRHGDGTWWYDDSTKTAYEVTATREPWRTFTPEDR